MEQRQFPIILLVMASILFLSYSIMEFHHSYLDIPEILGRFHVWVQWKLLPNW